jgi:NADPH:quinone reductase-like Zn-dependent oxidoreductase
MKVARYRAYGGPEQIEIAEQPDPTPREGELLVKVNATSVNPIDWKIASGKFPFTMMAPGLPYVPGHDVAGVVLRAAGAHREGERIYARIPGRKGGTSAEKVAFDARVAAKVPEGMSDTDAAAIPLAALTALQGLRDEGAMPFPSADGHRVLVVGGSGGVGHFAVQIARAVGAHVTAVCSGRNVSMVSELGAHEVIDYTTTQDYLRGDRYEVILDCVGGEAHGRFTPWLSARGRYVSTLPGPGLLARQTLAALVGSYRVRAVMVRPSADDLALLSGLYTEKKLRVVVAETYPLERLADAHRQSIEGRARGKIVVTVP